VKKEAAVPPPSIVVNLLWIRREARRPSMPSSPPSSMIGFCRCRAALGVTVPALTGGALVERPGLLRHRIELWTVGPVPNRL
jgi:hypothetical protein